MKFLTTEKVPNLDLIVFDLDYTLWPFWVDTHVDPPFQKDSSGRVRDARGKSIAPFPEVPQVLQELRQLGYRVAIASRTSAVEEARDLVRLFAWEDHFSHAEIYPGSKTAHFSAFHRETSVPFERMLFFDDEHRNIQDLTKMGVVSILVERGVSRQVVHEGIETFVRQRGQGST